MKYICTINALTMVHPRMGGGGGMDVTIPLCDRLVDGSGDELVDDALTDLGSFA